jgi:hypothetical protein
LLTILKLSDFVLHHDARRGGMRLTRSLTGRGIGGLWCGSALRRGVAWAIREGRNAARGIDRYLMGGTRLPQLSGAKPASRFHRGLPGTLANFRIGDHPGVGARRPAPRRLRRSVFGCGSPVFRE